MIIEIIKYAIIITNIISSAFIFFFMNTYLGVISEYKVDKEIITLIEKRIDKIHKSIEEKDNFKARTNYQHFIDVVAWSAKGCLSCVPTIIKNIWPW